MLAMDGIFTNLKRSYASATILQKLIYINVALFLLLRLLGVFLMLFDLYDMPCLLYLQLPSSLNLLLYRPWTLLTYMFTHFDFSIFK